MNNRLDKIKYRAHLTSFTSSSGDRIVPLSKEDYEYLITCTEAQQGYFATKGVIIMGNINKVIDGVLNHMDEKSIDNLLYSKSQMDKNRYLECLLKIGKKLETPEKVTHSVILEIKSMINVELGKFDADFN